MNVFNFACCPELNDYYEKFTWFVFCFDGLPDIIEYFDTVLITDSQLAFYPPTKGIKILGYNHIIQDEYLDNQFQKASHDNM